MTCLAISCHVMTLKLIVLHLGHDMVCHVICHVMSCPGLSCHVLVCHFRSCQTILCHVLFILLCLVMLCYAMTWHIMSHHGLIGHALTCHAMSHHRRSFHSVLSDHAKSCHVRPSWDNVMPCHFMTDFSYVSQACSADHHWPSLTTNQGRFA